MDSTMLVQYMYRPKDCPLNQNVADAAQVNNL